MARFGQQLIQSGDWDYILSILTGIVFQFLFLLLDGSWITTTGGYKRSID